MEIEKAVSEDNELLSYKASTFYWPNIKKKKENVDLKAVTKHTEEELKNRIEMDRKIKMFL